MRAVDTNVLVRVLMRDDAKQLAAAEEFVSKGAWVSNVVLAETVWVLESIYKLDTERLVRTVEMLLNHAQFTIELPGVVTEALRRFRKRTSVDFADYLMLEIARSNGHLPFGTFDRKLAKVEGVHPL